MISRQIEPINYALFLFLIYFFNKNSIQQSTINNILNTAQSRSAEQQKCKVALPVNIQLKIHRE